MSEHIDATGRELKLGDLVAYATSSHAQAELRFGRIVRLKYAHGAKPFHSEKKDGAPKLGLIAVERVWEEGQYSWSAKPTDRFRLVSGGNETTAGLLNAVLKITAEQLPPGVQELLDPPVP